MEVFGSRLDSRWAACLAAAATVVGYMVIVLAVGAIGRQVLGGRGAVDAKSVVSTKITTSAVGQVLGLILLAFVMRRRGLTFSDLGILRTPRPAAWIAAAVLAGMFVLLLALGPLRSRISWFDLSAFRIYTALLAGLAAGFCEEILFRGYVMTELARGGVGIAGQLAGTALLFGLAHVGWSSLGSGRLALGPMLNTGIAGLLYGAVYLIGGRSLIPVIAAHTITDMLIEPWLLLAMVSR